MKKKRYLKTVEDVIALKDTDTKIYAEKEEERYYQFVKGVLCCFSTNDDYVCIGDWVTLTLNLYILEEEPMQEATEEDVGKLCYCWNVDNEEEDLGVLKEYDEPDSDKYHINGLGWYKHCRRLSPAEVSEITGYKVEEPK